MSKEIIIIDYGLGNILSLKNTLEFLGFKVNYLSANPKKKSDIYIIPGVGSFKKAMKLIKKKKIDIFINKLVQKKTPIIGICLGMQIMGSWGYEDGKTKGLGLIDFSIKKLPTESKKSKLPNIGWKNVNFSFKKFSIFKKFNNKKFYFVHSFAIQKLKKNLKLQNQILVVKNSYQQLKKIIYSAFNFTQKKAVNKV